MEFLDRIPVIIEASDVILAFCVALGVALGIAARLPSPKKHSRH